MRKILSTGETVGEIGRLLTGARYGVLLARAGSAWRMEARFEGVTGWIPASEDENESKTFYFDVIPNAEYRIARASGNGNAEAWISEPMFVR